MFYRDSLVTLSYFPKRGDTRSSASYESLIRVPRTGHSDECITHVVVAKQLSRERCLSDVIR